MGGGLSQTLRLLVKGDSSGAQRALKGLDKRLLSSGKTGSTFGNLMRKGSMLAAGAIGALVAGVFLLYRTLKNWAGVAKTWVGGMVNLQRITGLSTEQVSILAGQFRLAGVESAAGGKGVLFFQKNLYAAQQGTKTMADAFSALNVNLKDSNGKWREGTDVLAAVRDRFSQMTNATDRTALAVKLFGRGGVAMLPWLMKSKDTMAAYTEDIKRFGMFTDKDIGVYKKFMGHQRLVGYMFDMLKVKAGLLAMDLLNRVYPVIEKFFEDHSEDLINGFKGVETVILEVAKVLGPVVDKLEKVYNMGKAVGSFFYKPDSLSLKGSQEKFSVLQNVNAALAVRPATITSAREMGLALSDIRTQMTILQDYKKLGIIPPAAADKSLAALSKLDKIGTARFLHLELQAKTSGANAGKGIERGVAAARPTVPAITGGEAQGTAAGRAAAKALAAALRGSIGANIVVGFTVQKRAKGGDDIVTRPTLFLAGEAGPERATFTPLNGKAGGGSPGGGMTLHVHGNVYGVADLAGMLAEAMSIAQRRAARGMV